MLSSPRELILGRNHSNASIVIKLSHAIISIKCITERTLGRNHSTASFVIRLSRGLYLLVTHKRTHTGQAPAQSSHCDKTFSQKSNIHTYMITCFSDLTYRTHYAPTTSILSSSWNQHTSPVYHTNRPRKRHHQSLSTI